MVRSILLQKFFDLYTKVDSTFDLIMSLLVRSSIKKKTHTHTHTHIYIYIHIYIFRPFKPNKTYVVERVLIRQKSTYTAADDFEVFVTTENEIVYLHLSLSLWMFKCYEDDILDVMVLHFDAELIILTRAMGYVWTMSSSLQFFQWEKLYLNISLNNCSSMSRYFYLI
jgi:hypothetical protein